MVGFEGDLGLKLHKIVPEALASTSSTATSSRPTTLPLNTTTKQITFAEPGSYFSVSPYPLSQITPCCVIALPLNQFLVHFRRGDSVVIHQSNW